MISLDYIYHALQKSPGLTGQISLTTVLNFIRTAHALENTIIHAQPPSFDPAHIPAQLPYHLSAYISQRLELSVAAVDGLWAALNIAVWIHAEEMLSSGILPRMDDDLAKEYKLCTYHSSSCCSVGSPINRDDQPVVCCTPQSVCAIAHTAPSIPCCAGRMSL